MVKKINQYLMCDFPGCDDQDADTYYIDVPFRGAMWVDLCLEHSKAIKLLYYAVKQHRDALRAERERKRIRRISRPA